MVKHLVEGSQIKVFTSQFGMTQVITAPIHNLEIYRSCEDLIFTSQPDIVMDSVIHSSLHSHCHHQIINATEK